LEGSSRRAAGEGEGDVVGVRSGISFGHPRQEVAGRRAISSINGEGVREVFVQRYSLVRGGGGNGELNVGRICWRLGAWRAWNHMPTVVYLTESGLVDGEGSDAGGWIRCAIDDICSFTVDRVGEGVESTLEVPVLVYIGRI